ncbi:MAG: hypothetical protein Q4A35_00955 [Candidatus Gracilibacteria bacterium]|nr:hypothetical protein [Candidatus Gracilibacteria bacterium]
MKVTFYSPTFYISGIDQPQSEETLYCEDIDFNPQTQKLRLEGESGSYQVIVEDIYIPETRDEKFARVYKKLLELPELNATTNTAILEGLEFSPKEIYELTADRVYGGNPYEPTVIVGNMVFNKNDPEFLEDTQKKLMLSNQILAFFGMDKLGPLEREEAKKKAREEIEMMKLTPAKKSNS